MVIGSLGTHKADTQGRPLTYAQVCPGLHTESDDVITYTVIDGLLVSYEKLVMYLPSILYMKDSDISVGIHSSWWDYPLL